MPILTARMQQAIRDRYPPALLVAIDHPSGIVYFWTGVGSLVWDSKTWTGVGVLGGITPLKRISDLQIQDLQFRLSGVPPQQATWLSSNVRNRTAQAWLAALNPDGSVVRDPYALVDALLDYQSYNIDENGMAQIAIIAKTGFYTLDRSLNEVWSTEDQKTRYPTDTGLDMMSLLVNQTVNWTRT